MPDAEKMYRIHKHLCNSGTQGNVAVCHDDGWCEPETVQEALHDPNKRMYILGANEGTRHHTRTASAVNRGEDPEFQVVRARVALRVVCEKRVVYRPTVECADIRNTPAGAVTYVWLSYGLITLSWPSGGDPFTSRHAGCPAAPNSNPTYRHDFRRPRHLAAKRILGR